LAQEPCSDGYFLVASVIDVNGTLYGTTLVGGGNGCDSYGCGTVFALDPSSGALTVLHTFAGQSGDGATPAGGLINVNGTLYGTTEEGGGNNYCPNSSYDGCGTVFSIDPTSGTEKVVHSFKDNNQDGQNPLAGLIEVKGKLYGTIEYGGAYGYGTVFAGRTRGGRGHPARPLSRP
jgi:uncharacterized repeat protein (TIGR03803 family)